MKKTYTLFFLLFSCGVALGAAAYPDDVAVRLHFLWERPYHSLLVAALAAALGLLAFRRSRFFSAPFYFALKAAYGILFLPVLLLPVFRCSFRIPFVFCAACQTKCPWGMARIILISGPVLLNLAGARFWCAGLCPFGSFQDCQSAVSKRGVRLPAWLGLLPYAVLAAVAGLIAFSVFRPVPALLVFMQGYYVWIPFTVAVAGLIAAAAFFVPRFWCRYFCPVGAIATLSSRLKRRLTPNT